MFRVLHFSDIHVKAPYRRLPPRELLNKRLLAILNLKLRRGRRFKEVFEKLRGLEDFYAAERPDLVVCTGDYTATGTEAELALARKSIDALTKAPHGFATVPGNHDIYLHDCVRERRFERHFGEFLHSDLDSYAVDGPYPIVKLPADDVAVVCVNSARPNPQPWRSSGWIPEPQLRALERVFADPKVRGRFVIVMTHYAPRLQDGRPDAPHHGLVNADAFLAACACLERGAVLHGHVHHRFSVRVPEMTIPILGAGSATDAGREGFWVLEIDGESAVAIPGEYAKAGYRLLRDAAVPL